MRGQNPGQVADDDHGAWYRELFAPSVTTGLLKPSDLAGYRNGQVYIRKSMHVPLNPEAVRDAMPTLFDLLREETHPAVCVVLGHFFFVYIHPYMDGNGRIGRFLMNVMMAAGRYPSIVIPVGDRSRYMTASERGAWARISRHSLISLPGLRGTALLERRLVSTAVRASAASYSGGVEGVIGTLKIPRLGV